MSEYDAILDLLAPRLEDGTREYTKEYVDPASRLAAKALEVCQAARKRLETDRTTHQVNWRRNERYYDGDFYDVPAWVKNLEVTVSFNECRNHIRHLAAWLTDRIPRLDSYPASYPAIGANRPDPELLDKKSKDMARLLRALWVAKRWHLRLEDLVTDAMIYGSGVAKVLWDGSGADGLGEVDIAYVSPWNFYVDSAAKELSEVVMAAERREVYEAELEMLYPAYRRVAEVTKTEAAYPSPRPGPPSRPAQITGTAVSESSTGGGVALGATGQAEDVHRGTVRVWDLYVYLPFRRSSTPENKLKDWALLSFVEDQILEIRLVDMFPFCHLRYSPHHERIFWGQSYVDMTAEVQRAANILSTMLNRQIHQTSEPVWVEERGAVGTGRVQRIRPGMRRIVQDGFYDRVGYKIPPPLQAEAFRFMQACLEFHETASGISGPMRGAQPQANVFVGAQQMAAEATHVLVRRFARAMEREMESLLTKAASLAATNLIAGRVIPLPDDETTDRFLELQNRHFYVGDRPLNFLVHFEAGTTMAVNRSLRTSNALRYYMATGGAPGPLWLAQQFGIEGAAEVVAEGRKAQESQLQPTLQQLQGILGKMAEATGALRNLGEGGANAQRPGPEG